VAPPARWAGSPGSTSTSRAPTDQLNVTYAGIGFLTVNTAGADDTVRLGDVTEAASVFLNTGAGFDAVVVNQTIPITQTTTINLGDDDDTLDVQNTANNSTLVALGGNGNDTFNVWATGNGLIKLKGLAGNDVFRVVGTGVQGTLLPQRDSTATDPNPVAEDTLLYDAKGHIVFPFTPDDAAGECAVLLRLRL